MKAWLAVTCVLGLSGCGLSSEPAVPTVAETEMVAIQWVDHPIWRNRRFDVHHHIAEIAEAIKVLPSNLVTDSEPPDAEPCFVLRFTLKNGRLVEIPVYDGGIGQIEFKLGGKYYMYGAIKLFPAVLRLSRLIARGTEDFDDRLLRPHSWSAHDPPAIDSMTLYSLQDKAADVENEQGTVKGKVETFHRYPVLGKLDVGRAADRIAILAAFQQASTYRAGGAECFDPHHGLRLTRDGTTIDYVICFHCTKYDECLDGLEIFSGAEINESAKGVLDGYLQKASIPQEKL